MNCYLLVPTMRKSSQAWCLPHAEARMRIKSDINITPLIDVLLVLLVIFMVITPLTPQGLDASIPHPAGPREQQRPETSLILSLDRNGGIHLNQEMLDL